MLPMHTNKTLIFSIQITSSVRQPHIAGQDFTGFCFAISMPNSAPHRRHARCDGMSPA
jgi:hypothetical protein